MLQGDLLIAEQLGIPLGQVVELDDEAWSRRWAEARWLERRQVERTKWALVEAVGTLVQGIR